MKFSTDIATPKHNKKHDTCVLGWNKYVKFYKEKSIYWHEIWKEGGSPSSGQLFDIKQQTKKSYHKAIKFVKRNREKIIREKIALSLQNKQSTKFWKEIKKLN